MNNEGERTMTTIATEIETDLDSLASLSARLEHAQTRAKELARADDRLAEYKSEVKIYEEALSKLDEVEQYLGLFDRPNLVTATETASSIYYQLRNKFDDAKANIDRQYQEQSEQVRLYKRYTDAVPYLHEQIDERQAQIKRLRGGLLSGLLTRIGQDEVIPKKDLRLIIDIIRATKTDATMTARQSIADKIAKAKEQTVSDLATWAEQNEVQNYSIRELRYSMDGHTYSASLLYRAIQHSTPLGKDGISTTWKVDETAWLLQVPFEPMQVQRMLKGKATYQPLDLVERIYRIDDAERVTQVIGGRAESSELFVS